MRVTAWSNGRELYGIRIGTPNRERHFHAGWTHVVIELDGATHAIALSPGFWRSCPEIRSPVLTEWLRLQRLTHWPLGHPPALELAPLGDSRFRLQRAEDGTQPALPLVKKRARSRV